MKAAFRIRRRRQFQRFCCGGFALLAAVWFGQVVYLSETSSSSGKPDRISGSEWSSRRLLLQSQNLTIEPEQPEHGGAISEFPDDVFTKDQRQSGAVLLHVLCAIYMFYALAIVCDDFFVPSLEKISENLNLSEDVAGATFMAAGSSAPELFTSLIGVFITKGDVGVGTIVGSAVFNILVIIGLCGIFAGQTVVLTWWSLFRDSLYYLISVLVLILVIYDAQVVWWESMLLMSMYGIYILIMKFNSQISALVAQQCRGPGACCVCCHGSGGGCGQEEAGEEGGACNTSMVLLRKAPPGGQDSPVVMVDELLSVHPHQLSFSEAGLRIMITPHFSPRTRLSMASRVVISERQRLIRESRGCEFSQKSLVCGGGGAVENGGSVEHQTGHEDGEAGGGADGEQVAKGGAGQPEEEEDGGDEIFRPFRMPDSACARVKWLVSWPLGTLLYCTVPNCMTPRWQNCFMATFATSTLWIAIFSYLMVWMVTIISDTLNIPDYIMGITFLAAGTSVPDCMASLIVARQGMGDMAVSNSIGSNIFDILLGLGFPWALRTLVVEHGSLVHINNRGLVYSVILLLASVFLTVLSIHVNNWRLDRRLGVGLLLLYAIFLLCSVFFGL